ncbi:MAG: hypothetical protein QNJ90_04000 [Planctomycetota bacterium]|nr:hypothetical protein [Planctomycetota bacterium]
MGTQVRRVNYFYVTVEDQPGEGFRLFTRLAEMGVDLVAFTGVPVGPLRTQFTIFPADKDKLRQAADQMRMTLDGPYEALLAQGDDELGALAEMHHILFDAGVNVYASSGASDGKGAFGYVIYVKPEQMDKAAEALGALMTAHA